MELKLAYLECNILKVMLVHRDVTKAWKLGGVCAYLPELKNIFEIYLNI